LLVQPPDLPEFGELAWDLYAPTERWEATVLGPVDYVLVSRNLPPKPNDVIRYFEIDAEKSHVGLMKTGRFAGLQVWYVEQVNNTCWYVCGVRVCHVGNKREATN
jgi:hypothetical protein